jgi:hypothetical protein
MRNTLRPLKNKFSEVELEAKVLVGMRTSGRSRLLNFSTSFICNFRQWHNGVWSKSWVFSATTAALEKACVTPAAIQG